MQKHRKALQPSQVEYALAIASYRQGQERLKYLLKQMLRKYGKPRMSLEELRATLDAELGSVSLSEEVASMRAEGY
ncbi:MAG: hypothetical protein HYY01_09825 [Chloroflexi bacterium]|nr:hypothetical protein [Chloroflexota bacterium]